MTLFLSFHHLFSIKIHSSDPKFESLMRSEYPNFIVPEGGEPDLEIRFGPFVKERLASWKPFFSYKSAADAVYEEKRYKTARWQAAILGLMRPRTTLFFDGNRRSMIFFIGEILEPLMRFKLAQKGIALIHSSCVALGDRGILVSGIRHTGKTLVMLKALFRGASLLSDDYTFVDGQKRLYGYPKKVNFFVTHFRELPELKPYWKNVPTSERLKMRLYYAIRRITGDYAVLGYQRFLTDLIPRVELSDSAGLSRLVLLASDPGGGFSVKKNVPPEAAVARLAANNQWECLEFQKMLTAYAYENPQSFANDWLGREAELISRMAKGIETIEISIPDFSPDTLNRYLRAVEEEVLK
ncbi:MAG: hypothetical protein HY541_00675 [Deltaproteobacteria bacterium]|nr:hypothetical protein [Deltaproteobacteria bacterium]